MLTVGKVTESNLKRKGLLTFARASPIVPEARFVVAASQEPEAVRRLKAVGGDNLEFTGELSDEALHRLAGIAKVYVQVSYTEGFGLALAEAMSAGCVPVVTPVGALPEVVGDCGLYVPEGDPVATANAIRQALTSSQGSRSRRRIEEQFPLDARKKAIRRIATALSER